MQRVTPTNLSAAVGSEPNYRAPIKQNAVSIPEGAVAAVNQLFIQLRAIFPAWKQSFPDEASYREAKRIWLETLVNAGVISFAQLQVGIEKAKQARSPFFPSVGEFVSWCNVDRYVALGLPNEEKLLRRIKRFMFLGMENVELFKFASNAEYWLITSLYQRNQKYGWSEEKLKLEIKLALKEMANRIESGEQIPEPRKQLPPEVKKPATEETIRNHIASWRMMFRQRVAQ